MTHDDDDKWTIPRRSFLHAGVVGAGAALLAACGGGTGTSGGSGGVASGPRTAANGHMAPPDLPWTNKNLPPTYFKLPAPFKSVSRNPGQGGPLRHLTWLTDSYNPPAPDPGSNKYWSQLNQRIGASLEPVYAVSDPQSTDQKFATLLASGDLPDVVLFSGSSTASLGTPSQAQALQQGVFTDLSHYLSGSAISEYPNLAQIAPRIWQNSRINGRFWGVPRPRVLPGSVLVVRKDWTQKVDMPLDQIKNAADFTKLMVAFAKKDPDGNGKPDTFGMTDIRYGYAFIAGMFRVPNQWRRAKNGNLTKEIETEEFRAMVSYARDLVKQGGFYPDAASVTTAQHYSLFESMKTGAYWETPYAIDNTRDPYLASLGVRDGVGVLMPPGHDGGKGVSWNALGFNGIVMIPSKTGKDEAKVRQILRTVDYFAAPFGSEEYRFLQFGVEGVDHTVAADGSLALTAQGKTDIGDLNHGFTPPIVTYNRPTQYFNQQQQEPFERYTAQVYADDFAIGIDDPTIGLYSETGSRKAPALTQNVLNDVIAIIAGSLPFSHLDDTIKSWRSGGGDQWRHELQQAMQKHG